MLVSLARKNKDIIVVLSKTMAFFLLCKEVPCLKNLQIFFFVTYRNIPAAIAANEVHFL